MSTRHVRELEVWLPGIDTPFVVQDLYYEPAMPSKGFDPGYGSELHREGSIKIGDDDFTDLLAPKTIDLIEAAAKEKLDLES